MKRYFRDKEVIGWEIIESTNPRVLCLMINDLMRDYEIIDCQYSMVNMGNYNKYSALVLLAKKVKK